MHKSLNDARKRLSVTFSSSINSRLMLSYFLPALSSVMHVNLGLREMVVSIHVHHGGIDCQVAQGVGRTRLEPLSY